MAELKRESSPVFESAYVEENVRTAVTTASAMQTPREKRHEEIKGENVLIEMYRKISGNAKRMMKYVPAIIDGYWLAKMSSKHAVSSWPKRTSAAKIKYRNNTQVEVGSVAYIPRIVRP